MKTSKIDRDKNLFFDIVKESFSVMEVARKMGYKPSGGVHKFLKLKFKQYELDISHFKGRGWNKGMARENDSRVNKIAEKIERKWEDVFRKDSDVKNSVLLRRLVSSGKREYKCFVCSNRMWQNKPLRLHLHHLNGDNTDNREENLDLVCPNCHSQTETFSRGMKNKKEDGCQSRWWINMSIGKRIDDVKKDRRITRKINGRINKIDISNEKLNELVSVKSVIEVGKILNISEKSVMKLCRIRGIKIPNKSFLRKKFDIDKEKMIELLKTKPILQIGKMFGVSDNAIRKRCKSMGINWKEI